MFSIDELRKLSRTSILTGKTGWSREEIPVRCFMEELEYRQKRGVKKRSVNHYQDWLYYIAYNGRLARVPNTAKNPLGKKLIKSNTLYYDDYGLLRADDVIPQGTIVKHRALMEELDPAHKWYLGVRDAIEKYLDGGKECTMTIDRDFETAYNPEYHDDFCLEGDLVTGCSCMSSQGEYAQEFYGGIDGCYVCRFEDEDGNQVGRCIMYEYNGQRHFIRIYAVRDYARCALRLLRKEMRENDLFGRSKRIENMCLSTNWTDSTHTMYLDGEYYGVNIAEGTVVDTQTRNYDVDFKTTGNEELSEYYDDYGFRYCEYCGCWFNEEDGVRDDDYNWYCCEDCAENAGCRKCEYCGEWHSDTSEGYETPEGTWYCCKRCLTSADYIICEHCGEVHYYEDAFEVNSIWYCDEDCAKADGWQQCDKCGDWHKDLIKNMNTGQYLCEDCAENEGLKLAYVSEKQFNKTNKKEVVND